ncbi:MAG: hypothetical protein K1W34_14100 [Lachnospiraceae bacterium]
MKTYFKDIAKCKKCGKVIRWVKMQSGKFMPCNPQEIGYKISAGGKGEEIIITPDGRRISADIVYEGIADGKGYISHFATCRVRKK